jgi:transcription antitermination factor NusG
MVAKWYAVYTNPRAEKRVNEKLKRAGIETYLPLHRTPRAWSDRVKLVDMPLFTSYVFVKCEEKFITQLYNFQGIARVLYNNGKPAVIRQIEIDAIKKFLELAIDKPLCNGDEVEILAGSLKKICGVVTRMSKRYIYLRIAHLNAVICVNISKVAPSKRLIR